MRLRWAGLLLALWTLVAVAVPWLPLQPDRIALEAILAPPGGAQWLGADDVGRPVLDRLLVGARTSFWVACWVVGLSLVAGTLVGSLAGYLGGRTDIGVSRLIEVFICVPVFYVILIALLVAEPSIWNAACHSTGTSRSGPLVATPTTSMPAAAVRWGRSRMHS